MVNTKLEKIICELRDLHIDELEMKQLASDLESVFLGEDNFGGSLEFFLNLRVSEV